MPGRTLPIFTSAEVAAHNSAASCYITVGSKVYDVTTFVEDHPGGGDLILDYAGKDVKAAMEDEVSHAHSESAWEILDDYLVGFVATTKTTSTDAKAKRATEIEIVEDNGKAVYEATGVASEEDLSIDTDVVQDYKKHKFLDLDRPLLMQVWNGGFSKKFYLEQVHRPRHYKGGESAPLFGNFLEPLSKTAWYVVPIVWLPQVVYGTYLAGQGLSPLVLAAYFIAGIGVWTLTEYGLHRGLFHLDNWLPDNRVAITLHFLLHGIHHYLPMDRLRLVMPPTLFVILATPFWKLAHFLFAYDWNAGTAVFCGGVFGYICYDLTHYFLHHANLPAYYKELKKYHMQHHFMDYENGFGVTSRFWDTVFGTELAPPPVPKVLKTV